MNGGPGSKGSSIKYYVWAYDTSKSGIRHNRCCRTKDVLYTSRLRQVGRNFADDVFTYIFFNECCCILIEFSLKYVRKGPIDNNPALVQIMAWRRSLSEPMVISLPAYICVTRPQWVNIWSPVNSPHKGQWRGALTFSLICARNGRLSEQSWGWWFETPSCSL